MNQFKIGNRLIGEGQPCFIVAEIGINFDGKFEQAEKLIEVAAEAGCDAVKFQLFKAEKMYIKGAGEYETASGEKKDIIKIVKEGELPLDWIIKLRDFAEQKGLLFFSTACDEGSVDELDKREIEAYKLASYAITHIPLLRHIARKNRPTIFSSGGATWQEVCEALTVFEEEGNHKIVLMHCIGKYPTPPEAVNMNILKTYQLAFPNIVVGYSDHTSDPIAAPVAAVAIGAKVVEKHITLDRRLPGPDHSFAVEPHELKAMVDAIRETERKMAQGQKIEINPSLLGSSQRKTFDVERKVRMFAYRSIFATRPIAKGELLTSDNIAVLRPGEIAPGIAPKYYELLVNQVKAVKDIGDSKALQWGDVLTGKKSKKIGIIIQARMGSTRLPGKILKEIGGKSLLQVLVERMKRCTSTDEIIIATSDKEKDLPIVNLAEELGVICVRGDEDDVLSRYVKAMREREIDVIVRICSDNPLTPPEFVDEMIRIFTEGNFDYAYSSDAPVGVKLEVASRDALLHVDAIKGNPCREHVTYYLLQHPEMYALKDVQYDSKVHNVRLTVDTPDDFLLMEKIHEHFGNLAEVDIKQVLEYLENHPEIKNLNAHVRQVIPSEQKK